MVCNNIGKNMNYGYINKICSIPERIIHGKMIPDSEFLSLEDLFFHNRNQDPAHTAIESPEHSPLTYQEMQDQITYVMKTLNTRGLAQRPRRNYYIGGSGNRRFDHLRDDRVYRCHAESPV
jgi:hypothetical protein